MTEDELSELVKILRSRAQAAVGMLGAPFDNSGDLVRRDDRWKAADAIESLRASVANAEKRAEDAEARNVFLETEIVALAEKVKKP